LPIGPAQTTGWLWFEEDVARVHDLRLGDEHEGVAARVRGSHLEELHVLVAGDEAELAGERLVRPPKLDPLELELAEALDDELAGAAELGRARFQAGERRRRRLDHLGRSRRGCDDARAAEQLVAEGVVAVRVRVDEHVDLCRRRNAAPDLVEHLACQPQVEERVDEHRGSAPDDEAGVAPAPAAARLEIRVEAVADLLEAAT
jgi:hypothetical protein